MATAGKHRSRCARAVRIALPAAFVVLAAVPDSLALDDDVAAALREEIEFLKSRIEKLEAQLEASVTEKPAVQPVQAAPPEPRAPALEHASVTVGGRIKLDSLYNSVSSGQQSSNRADLAFVPGAIPVTSNGEDDQIKFSARNSRLRFKARSPSPLGDVAAYIEIDFFASDNDGDESTTNGYTPRLRYGYGEWRGWLGGQTNSTMTDLRVYPEINDDGTPLGALIVRQPMVRWSGNWQGHEFMLSLESPDSTIRDTSGVRLTPDDERLPDVAARYTQHHAWGFWSLAAVVREIRIDDAAADGAAVGGAVTASGLVRIGKRDDLRFVLSGGNAVGRYLSLRFFDDARIDGDGDLDLSMSSGGYLAYRHWWSARWRSNVVLGSAWMDKTNALDSENEWGYSLHANLLWSPMLTTSLGVEWIHGERTLVGGSDGVLDRLQFTAIHKF